MCESGKSATNNMEFSTSVGAQPAAGVIDDTNLLVQLLQLGKVIF